jgi:hypothetical protein
MKKFLVLLIIGLIFGSVSVNAQRKVGPPKHTTEISLLGGYLFSGSYDGYNGTVDIKDAPSYGGAISFRPQRNSTLTIELEYLGAQPEVELRPYNTVIDTIENVDVSVNYFLVGVGYGTMVSPKTQLFSLFKLGMVYAAPSSSSRYESVSNFAVSLAGGAKFYLSKSVGIRLQAGLYFPVAFSGAGVFVGTGGVDYGVSSTSYVMQFNLGGGLIFMF